MLLRTYIVRALILASGMSMATGPAMAVNRSLSCTAAFGAAAPTKKEASSNASEVAVVSPEAASIETLLEEIRQSRSLFIDPFLFATDIASGRAIWDGLQQAFPLLTKSRIAVNLAHLENTDLDPTLVTEVIRLSKAALENWKREQKDPTPVDAAYITLNTVNEIFIRKGEDAKSKEAEKKKKEEEKKQEEQKKQDQKEKGKSEEQEDEEPPFPKPKDTYQPHNKDTDQQGKKGPKRRSIVEFNEPDITYFKTDHYQIIGPDGWFKTPEHETMRITPAGGATHVSKVKPGKAGLNTPLPVHVPIGFVPKEFQNQDGKVWKTETGNYLFESKVPELRIPMIPQGRAVRPLSPQEEAVYTTPTGFKFSEWPAAYRQRVEILKSEFERGKIDRMGVAKVVEEMIQTMFKYRVDKDEIKDIVQLVNQGKFQCDIAATLAVSTLRDEFKIPARIAAGDQGQENPRTPLSSHVISPATRHAWFEVPNEQGSWVGFDPTPLEKDRKVEQKGGADDEFKPISNRDSKEDKDQQKDGEDAPDKQSGKKGEQQDDKKDGKKGDQKDGQKGQKGQKGEKGQQGEKGEKGEEGDGEPGEEGESEEAGDDSQQSSNSEGKGRGSKKGDEAPNQKSASGGKPMDQKELIEKVKQMMDEAKKQREKEEAEEKAKKDAAKGDHGDKGGEKGDKEKGKNTKEEGEGDNDKDADSDSDSQYDKNKKDIKNKKNPLDAIDDANPYVKKLLQQLFMWAVDERLDGREKFERLNLVKGILGSEMAKSQSSFRAAKEVLSQSTQLFNVEHPSFEEWVNQIVIEAPKRPFNDTVDNLVKLQRQVEWTLALKPPHQRGSLAKMHQAINAIRIAIGKIRHPESEKIRIVEELIENLPGNISRSILRDDPSYLGGVGVGANQATLNLAKKMQINRDAFLRDMRTASALGPHTNFFVDPVYVPSTGEQRTILREALPKRRPPSLQITNDPRDRRGMVKLNPFITDAEAMRMGQMALLTQPRYVKVPEGFKDVDPEKATVICVDTSGSITGAKIEFQAQYISALVDRALSDVNPAGKAKHRVYIIPFDSEAYDPIEVTNGKEAAAILTGKKAGYRRANGGTDIEAAILAAVDQIKSAGEQADKALARATILVASDGGSTVDYKTVNTALKKAKKTEKHGDNKDMRVHFGFIAIGETNQDLIDLAHDSESLGADKGMYLEFDSSDISTIMESAKAPPVAQNDFWTDVKYSDAPLDVRSAFGRLSMVNGEYRVALSKQMETDSTQATDWLRTEAKKSVESREDKRKGSQKAYLWRLRDTMDLFGKMLDARSRIRIMEGVVTGFRDMMGTESRAWDISEISQIRHILHWPQTGSARDPKYDLDEEK